jgi:crotonobetaine/carnitine-CoA ligase
VSGPLERLVGRGRATVPELLEARAQRTPDAPFLRWEDRRWTYAEGLHEIRRFSGWAQASAPGDGAERRIASFLPNRAETMWAWLGSLASGAVYVPLNSTHRGEILEDMLRRSGADLLVTDLPGLESLPPLDGTSVTTVLLVDDRAPTAPPRGVRVATWSEVEAAAPAPAAAMAPSDPAIVMYTSGTTGRSKAVLMSHNQLCRGAGAVTHSLQICAEDVIHAWLPLYHVAGQVDSVLCTVIGGGEVDLLPTFSRSRFWQQVAASGATIFVGFSNVLEILWAMPPSAADADCSLRVGMIGAVPPTLHRGFEERFGVRLCDVYGMTEAEPLALPEPGVEAPTGSCGRANPDFEVVVLDDADQVLPAGAVGEIAARPRVPDVMFIRYEDDEPATLDACRTLWFHTGDLGRIDEDGFVYFVDRRKHAIRRRGENVSSWELESIIARHPAVDECCAVGIPSPLGDDDVKLVIAPKAEQSVEPAELRTWCEGRMAKFMLPRYIDVVDALPRNAAGKLQKEELRVRSASTWDAEAQAVGR